MTTRCTMPRWEQGYWRRTLTWRDEPPGADEPLHAAYEASLAQVARECGVSRAELRAGRWATHERAGERGFFFEHATTSTWVPTTTTATAATLHLPLFAATTASGNTLAFHPGATTTAPLTWSWR